MERIKVEGGHNEFSTKTITMMPLSGDVTEIPNSAVPVPETAELTYPSLTPLTTLVAQVITVKNRKWRPISFASNVKSFNRAYRGTGITMAGCMSVQKYLVGLFELDSVWCVMEEKTKDSVSGANLLQMIKMILGRLPLKSWLILNARLATNFFPFFVKRGATFTTGVCHEAMTDKNQSLYRRPAFVKVKEVFPEVDTEECNRMVKQYAPYAVVYQGGWVPKNIHLPAKAGTVQSMFLCSAFVRQVCGKNKGVHYLLDSAMGYSGLPSEQERRLCFQLGVVLFCWSNNLTPEIELGSVGDVPVLESSLLYLRERVMESKDPLFLDGEREVVSMTWTYKTGSESEAKKIPSIYQPRVRTERSPDTVLVFYVEDTATSIEQDKINEVELAAQSALIIPSGSYIGYATVFGWAHFAQDQDSFRGMSHGQSKKKAGYCFAHGSAAKMRGVITSVDIGETLYLVGREGKRFIPVKLDFMPTASKWYARAERDMVSVPLRWLCPMAQYSPISNLLVASKKVTQLQAQMAHWEEMGELELEQPRRRKADFLGEEVAPEWTSAPTSTAASEYPSGESEDDEEEEDEAEEDQEESEEEQEKPVPQKKSMKRVEEEEEEEEQEPRPKKERRKEVAPPRKFGGKKSSPSADVLSMMASLGGIEEND